MWHAEVEAEAMTVKTFVEKLIHSSVVITEKVKILSVAESELESSTELQGENLLKMEDTETKAEPSEERPHLSETGAGADELRTSSIC